MDEDQLRFEAPGLLDGHGRPAAWPRLGLLGRPVEHSLSPRLHRAALRARGLAGDYRSIEVAADDLAACLESAAASSVRGLNITLPHKRAVLDLARTRSEEAAEIGAANTLVHADGGWEAHNTDARGLAMALQRARGRELHAHLQRVCILGAGGAARAAVVAVTGLGARRIHLLARRPERAEWARRRGLVIGRLDDAALTRAGLVLQCTSLGLQPDDPSPIRTELLSPVALAFDLIYSPPSTAFLEGAAARGCPVENGLSMLVAQAALSFSMWVGGAAPLQTMAKAVGSTW